MKKYALFLGLAVSFLIGGHPPALAAQPNIVLILADDLGYGDLSSYGAKDLRSPNIDSLVERGIRFDNFYANCPVCSPTRASLLTGRYPDVVGVPGVIRTHLYNSWGFLDPGAVTLPELLRKAGYHTAIVGKWHLGLESPNLPTDRGFDLFRGWAGDMMDDYYTHLRHGINYMRYNKREIKPEGHATDLFTQWAMEYMEEQSRTDSPFFLYLAYNAPHTPIQPPEEWVRKVKEREPGIGDRRARLAALIEHMDHGIGQVAEKIRALGIERETLVVFTSDNGGQLGVGANNGDLRDGKQSMYEGGVKVPMCAVWPGRIRAGSASDEIGLTMDLMQTLCEAGGISVDRKIDGVSLMRLFEDPSASLPERDLYWVRREGNNRYMGKTIEAFRRGDWKLLQNTPTEPFELYNLKDDPGETRDLSGENREIYNQLCEGLRRQIQRASGVPWQNPKLH